MPQALNGIKLCSRCGETKPVSEFNKHKGYKDGLRYECKKCSIAEVIANDKKHPEKKLVRDRTYRTKHKAKVNAQSAAYRKANPIYHKEYLRNWHLKATYGITTDDYNDMFIEQGERCAICDTHQSNLKKILHVDHCHKTGRIRGLLCDGCNIALSRMKDNSDILRNAIKYLELGDS